MHKDNCGSTNFKLCTALDMTRLSMVLDEMRAAGLSDEEVRSYKAAAASLLALLRTANYRLHGRPPVPPTL